MKIVRILLDWLYCVIVAENWGITFQSLTVCFVCHPLAAGSGVSVWRISVSPSSLSGSEKINKKCETRRDPAPDPDV